MAAATLESLGITPEKITEYDKRIPRYTSYPTAPFWTGGFGAREWAAHLEETSGSNRPLSVYIHIPFCHKRCLFCGCNVIVSRKDWVADDYLDLMEKEIALFGRHYRGSGRVAQLHLGGGTPNYLTHEQMGRLVRMLEEAFPFAEDAERSIEVDPRLATPEDVRRLHDEHKFRRISYGTQDFNPETQESIGRGQTLDVTFANVEAARRAGFDSVNIDLIYGLPRQTAQSWAETIDGIIQLRPDRIAMYNFAFLPSKLAHQRTLDEADMPKPAEKLEMFINSYDRLTSRGWEFIGMDHYALADDSLTLAQHRGELHRNFMGYTTLRGTDMIAFGVSSIGDFQGAFAQNVKKLTEYRRAIEAGVLPIEHGLRLSDDDLMRRHMIEEIMCNCVLKLDAPAPGAADGEVREVVEGERDRLAPLIEDGLLTLDDEALRVTPKGRIFLRNIAVVFDAYLKKPSQGKPLFSRAV